jgi:DNA-directed RNA polymerase sigma subunit (sigma70/sigma32)
MKPGSIQTERDAKIVAKRKRGFTLLALATEFGLSKSRIRQIEYRAKLDATIAATGLTRAEYLKRMRQIRVQPQCR